MTDKNHITTTTANFKDWILGTGEFSEENLKKARDEFFAKLGKHWSDLMLASLDKAFSDLDAVPEAIANAESVAPQPTAGDRSGNPTSHSGTGNTPDRSKPINDDRMSALEELSALDQELEERHCLQGNPMIKAQRNNESI